MANPFLIKNPSSGRADRLTPLCSINKIVIAKLPVYGVDDSIEGMNVKSFFSAKIIANMVRQNAMLLHINEKAYSDKDLPRILGRKANDLNDCYGAKEAQRIIKLFGSRLGLMLLTLKLGETENRAARPEWTQEHWDYWKNVSDIILVGGLASGSFGEMLRDSANMVFAQKCVKPYNIILYANSTQAAVLGCATCINAKNGVFVVMDFGQTGIKRSSIVMKDGEAAEINSYETLPSKYMEWDIPDQEEKLAQAKKLHSYLISAIEQTYHEAKCKGKNEIGSEIIISIASYTADGVLDKTRGGYAKLCLLGENYAEILSWELSGRLRRTVNVKLIHDGTAVALNFRSRQNTVCLSVGSYFGVGFPETEL